MALGSLISMKDKLLELPGSIPGVLNLYPNNLL